MAVAISNLRYADAGNTTIDMDVSGWIDGETIPFTYHPNDTEPLSVAVRELLANANYTISPYKYVPVVYVVSPMQARIALLNAGLLDTIQSAIDAKGGAIKIKWEYATEIRSDDADLIAVATDIGIADQIPALFQAAKSI